MIRFTQHASDDGGTQMALIHKLVQIRKESNRVHDPVECGWTTFEDKGSMYIQLDTYGSQVREIPGKVSQSIQLDASSASALRRIIDRTYPTT
jgi:hypothetical protein